MFVSLSVCPSVHLSAWHCAALFILTKDCVSVTFGGVALSAHFQLPSAAAAVIVGAASASAASTWLYFVLFFISTQIVLFAAEHLAQRPRRLALLRRFFLNAFFVCCRFSLLSRTFCNFYDFISPHLMRCPHQAVNATAAALFAFWFLLL